MRRLLLPAVLLSSLFFSEAPQAQTGNIPLIDFSTKPSYLDKNVISLTFDDGPDLVNTPKVLDTLKEKGVKATFFICTHNVVNVDTNADARNLVKRIVAEGHELASHTVAHLHLPQQTPEKIESELAGVEKTVADIFGPGGPKLTLFRAPYGEPYTDGSGAAFNKVAPIGAKHGVHIGWAIDTLDWEKPNADAVYSSFTGLVKTPGTGAYGVVLMHSIHPQTAGALPRIIDYLNTNKFVIKQVEDVVRARYGKSSAEIFGVSAGTGGSGGSGTGGAAGMGGSAG
ncbi:MAG TPA: polysaccharide deacetylase family protein, partial [Polyangia bacterium]|nr:polysaccharide deacetylase family protein [Polyangia bacterium]